jgi:nicotinate-nucleotide adenylyltransferase
MEQRKRIAIYGGTFDPVHLGHLKVAKSVSRLFGIDQFLFVPARMAPHKVDREVSSGLDRYAMLALATQSEPRLCVSTFELDGPGRQYTIDTLSHFRSRFGETTDLFFVMGADSWAEITSWREWQRLIQLANLIVVTRPGYEISATQVGVEMAANMVDLRGAERKDISEAGPGQRKVFLTDAVLLDVSATEIRRAASEDNSEKLERLVPREVAEYIRKYQLYRNSHEA